MRQLSARDLKAWLDDSGREPPLLLDVREPWEVNIGAIPGSLHVPMGEVVRRVAEIDAGKPVVAVCHHGARSMQVALFLEKNGYKNVHNLQGGVDAWSRTVDPSLPVY
jgi:rhodanese-related sulfurtransferase